MPNPSLLERSEQESEYRKELFDKWCCYCSTVATNFALAHRMEKEDCRQECFIALWTATSLYDPFRGVSFKTYLVTTLWRALGRYKKTISKQIRGKINNVNVDQDFAAENKDTHLTDLRNELEALAARISSRSMKVLQLRMEGVTLEKIGLQLEISKERVRQVESKSINQLKYLYKEKCSAAQ